MRASSIGSFYNYAAITLESVHKTIVGKFDINTTGFNYFKGGAYQQAIDIFTLSSTKFPDDPYAYNMIGKSSWAIDTTMEKGMANAAFEKTIQLSLADTVKYKAQLLNSYKYFDGA